MTIKKFNGNTREEAIKAARDEMGPSVVIMNIKEVKPEGLFGFFKKKTYEVTAALDNEEVITDTHSTKKEEGSNFDAVAGEKPVINKLNTNVKNTTENSTIENTIYDKKTTTIINNLNNNPKNNSNMLNEDYLAEESLKNAFKAVNEVIQNKDIITEDRKDTKINKDKIRENINPREIMVKEHKEDDFMPFNEDDLSIKDKVLKEKKPENIRFVNMLYNTLLSNEVEETYVNQIVRDMEKIINNGNNLDHILSNVYQKMVLMMGKPSPIVLSDKKPLVVFFIGPTGVGKTTTIAKLASKEKFEKGKNVGFLTTDTYRIAATDQLKIYANIMEIPLDVVLTKNDINKAIQKMSDKDLIIVDTAGFSHKNEEQKKDMKDILIAVDKDYNKCVYLVLSATTKYRDIKNIIDTYKSFTDFNLIFTKLDETDAYGSILSAKLYSDKDLSYVCTGQSVPDDIEIIDIQKIVKQLLGGK